MMTSPKGPQGDSAMTSKQVICTMVGVQPMPRFRRQSRSAAGKALPRSRPERSGAATEDQVFAYHVQFSLVRFLLIIMLCAIL